MRLVLPTVLEAYAGGAREVEVEGQTLAELLLDLDTRFPGIRFRMVNERDELRPHMRIFVNGSAVRSLETAIAVSDEVFILQSLSGG